ncbi:MAG: hypothetical protein WCP98_21485, partial [Actinomycetes bacterium]
VEDHQLDHAAEVDGHLRGAAALTTAPTPMRPRKAATRGRCSACVTRISLSRNLASLIADFLSSGTRLDTLL